MKYDLKHLQYNQFFQINTIFTDEIIHRASEILLGKWGKWKFFNICLRTLEVIEVTEANMCANQSISM